MISEHDYVIKSFRDNFKNYENKNIVIYGIGVNTKNILNECKDFNVVALMDPTMVGKRLWDKPVIDCSELLEYKTDIIVIVARYCNVSIIYNRIADYCVKKEIPVYDINGNLLERKKNEKEIVIKKIEKKQLKDLIDLHDIISFDIFDTLITRKTLYPIDVFELVEKEAESRGYPKLDFAIQRINAEKKCNAKGVPDIWDIYEEICIETGIEKTVAEQYMELELYIEKKVIVIRREMLSMLDYAYKAGKQVYLISDMYWPKKILKEILNELGICSYTDLFVSSEYHLTKGNGLYEVYKDATEGMSYLHIGDNYEIDYLMARQSGIDAYHVLSGYEMLRQSKISDLLEKESEMNLSGRCMVGFYVAKVFENPFLFEKTKGKVFVDKEEDFGYIYLGPIITQYMMWMTNKVQNSQDAKILFTARDGFLLKILYEAFKNKHPELKLPKAEYFLTSRISSVISGIKTNEDIVFAMELPFSGTVEQLLEKRFFLTKEEILLRNKNESDIEYVLRHSEVILKISEKYAKNEEKYLSNVLNDNHMYYWVDFVSSGTCQYYFQKKTNTQVQGLYFYRFTSEDRRKSKLLINSLYKENCAYTDEQWLQKIYIFLETIMTSYFPTIKNFDDEGNPIYLKESREPKQIKDLQMIHNGIIRYFQEYISLNLGVSNLLEVPDNILGDICNRYNGKEMDFIQRGMLLDEFANRKFYQKNVLRQG